MPNPFLAAVWASRRGRSITLVAVLVVAVLAWWWYPTMTGEAADTDVTIVGDSFLQSAEREITYRIREDGFSLVWATTGAPGVTAATDTTTSAAPASQLTWCDAPAAVQAAVARDHPDIVVVSFAEEGSCGTDPVAVRAAVRAAAGSAKLIAVAYPADEYAPLPSGSVVVRPSRLIGPVDNTTEGCLWFDSNACLPNGRVEVRTADGGLAPSGQTRVARMIVTALRE